MAKVKSIKQRLDEIEEKIIVENLEDILGERFGRYAKYIIQDRALPDVRDGLKPVQRRILYAMFKLGMFSNKPYKKSARIVGDVIGKYHPHGDTSVYDAMVRLSQSWKMRMQLIDMHGNNGSVDGDPSAAMRYTEARMSPISEYLLKDIDKYTVDFIPNFDDEEYEPTVLPARYPNILVNGATGISAGYATEIPPHNISEIIQGVIYRINNNNCTLDDLMEIVKGPDFPTGGTVQGIDEIRKAFSTGRGKIVMRSKSEIIKNQIIITELPYEVNKANLVRRIEDIRISKKIDGMQEVRDESDREGLRVVIDIKKEANAHLVLNYLLKSTDLQKTYNYNMVAINSKRPQLMGLIDIFDAYIFHQKEVTTNRSNYELEKARGRLHIVEGLTKMVSILDEVIQIIRNSNNKRDSKDNLISRFEFSELQAEAIVTLQLYRLSNTDILELQKEDKKLNATVKRLRKILRSEKALEEVIRTELENVLEIFGSERKTIIEAEIEKIVICEEDLISNELVYLSVSEGGYIKRSSPKSYKASGEKDGCGIKDGDSLMCIHPIETLNTLLMFTNLGNYIFLPIHKIQESKWKDLGTHISGYINLKDDEVIIEVFPITDFTQDMRMLLSTKNGLIKQMNLIDFNVSRYSRPIKCISLNKGDKLVSIDLSDDYANDIVCVLKNGYALRYEASEVPVIGNTGKGVKAITVKEGEQLAGAIYANAFDESDLVIVTNRGTMRRIPFEEITKLSRNKRGASVIKILKSNPYLGIKVFRMTKREYLDKNRVLLRGKKSSFIMTTFDIKIDRTETGKSYVETKQTGLLETCFIERFIKTDKFIKIVEPPSNDTTSKDTKDKDDDFKLDENFIQTNLF